MKRRNIKETRGKYSALRQQCITADKRKKFHFAQIRLRRTSLIRGTLYEMAAKMLTIKNGGK